MKELMKTDEAWTGFVLRLSLGVVLWPHGMSKLLGWYGGHGFSATMDFFTSTGMPAAVAFLVIIGESLGSVALLLGFWTRFTATAIAVIMIGAVQMVHIQHGFFMNWFGESQGEGFEYHLLVIGICLGLIVGGGGKWSLDHKLSSK